MARKLKLTDMMIRQLYDCRDKLFQNIPCKQSHFPQTLKGLLKRELIDFKNTVENGKLLLTVVITDKGLEHLKMLEQQEGHD